MSESDLIRRCQTGDVYAFEMLVEKYSDKAVRTAYLVTGRKDIAEDIAQEAFIKCFYSIKRLKRMEFFRTWFYRILVRTAWKMASKAGKPGQLSIDDEGGENLSDGYDLAEDFAAREAGEAVYKAASGLSKPLKEVVVLHYLNDFTIKEIAEVLNCREGTVKSRLFNARKQLAEKLKQNGWDVLNSAGNQSEKESGFNVKTSTV